MPIFSNFPLLEHIVWGYHEKALTSQNNIKGSSPSLHKKILDEQANSDIRGVAPPFFQERA